MNKTAIKNYAIWAREELINRVTRKAYFYGVSKDDIVDGNVNSLNGELLTSKEIEQRKKLIEKVKHNGFDQVIEEVAYTWFNRFIALRYMEVNNYLPFKTRVFTNENNEFKPQIMQEAMQLDISNIDKQIVYEFVETKDDEGLFKYLLIAICNDMGNYLPGMFTTISDYKVLLFPDNLLDKDNVIGKLISEIDEDSWTDQVTLIGWLYQFYNTEPKAKVYARKKGTKIEKEDIPAVTQLFTPDWICKYMVENSLGRLWLDGHTNDELKSSWKYYLDEAHQEDGVIKQLNAIKSGRKNLKVEDIKIIDPCMGSGHILVYAFDVLMQIYQSEGWTSRDAAISILENNLYGLDIDERAYQLAYFALMMKARSYNRKALTLNIKPNVYEIVESNDIYHDILEGTNVNKKSKTDYKKLIAQMSDVKEYGSLTKIYNIDFPNLKNEITSKSFGIFDELINREIIPLIDCAEVLSCKFDVVVTNPPYTPISSCSKKLQSFVLKNFPNSKADFCSVFIERNEDFLSEDGLLSMITMQSWMFLTSFEQFRKTSINDKTFINLVHLGSNAFHQGDVGTIVQAVAFTMLNKKIDTYKSLFIKLTEPNSTEIKEIEFIKNREIHSYKKCMDSFTHIPGTPISYWLKTDFINLFAKEKIEDFAFAKAGVVSGNDDYFIRYWYEVNINEINYDTESFDIDNLPKWSPMNKGGLFRKYYGNTEHILRVDDLWNSDKVNKSVRRGDSDTYYKEGITWTLISGNHSSFRYSNKNIYGVASPAIFVNKTDIKYVLALLNSKIASYALPALNPTVNMITSNILALPFIESTIDIKDEICKIANQNIMQCKTDWDSYETSWDFKEHPLIKWSKFLWDATAIGVSMLHFYGKHVEVNSTLELCYLLWQGECNEKFNQLKSNEEELNRIFIEIYGLQDELTPEVDDKDVTVRKANLTRDIKSFISYAVGCMFGRYSLDEEGLAFAGGEFNSDKYKTFKVDKDNIIPICDDEYFDDDIVGRFIQFVEVVYGKDSLQDNLKFIADALGGKGNPKDVIRNYFLNDFYNDHCKIYQKRPIYWLFDSGKKNGFKALIYIHRYQPDLIARMRTDYVHETQSRYAHSIEMIEQQLNENITTSKKVKLNKELTKLKAQSEEVRSYEEIVHHWADKMEPMNLDDGVKANYEKFKDLLAKIK